MKKKSPKAVAFAVVFSILTIVFFVLAFSCFNDGDTELGAFCIFLAFFLLIPTIFSITLSAKYIDLERQMKESQKEIDRLEKERDQIIKDAVEAASKRYR